RSRSGPQRWPRATKPGAHRPPRRRCAPAPCCSPTPVAWWWPAATARSSCANCSVRAAGACPPRRSCAAARSRPAKGSSCRLRPSAASAGGPATRPQRASRTQRAPGAPLASRADDPDIGRKGVLATRTRSTHEMFNWMKTAILMAGIMALFGVVGSVIGGRQGMLMALAFGAVGNFFAYWFSDKMVLRMYNAKEVDDTSAPQFYNMVKDLAARAELPMPRVYLIDE